MIENILTENILISSQRKQSSIYSLKISINDKEYSLIFFKNNI